MLAYRLCAYATTRKLAIELFGPDLSDLDLDNMLYFQCALARTYRAWVHVPALICKTFDRLGVPLPERKYLAGASAQ